MCADGAVDLAAEVLRKQVERSVGDQDVTAYTDVFDQVFWTQKSSWAAPIGSLGNRLLPCVYFGMSFVKPKNGPLLALHVSWHKPASTLHDALEALHDNSVRHAWLSEHVRIHILDRGTQGDPMLRWARTQGIPYLTITRGHTHWRRFSKPTSYTKNWMPIYVREDVRLRDSQAAQGRATLPQVIVFPANPAEGESNGKSLRYRTSAALEADEIRALNDVYKTRWPNNENGIKALVAVGFDRNLDRTLAPTSSRGKDGAVRREQAALATVDVALESLKLVSPKGEGRAQVKLEKKRAKIELRLAEKESARSLEAAGSRGSRMAKGAEPLAKIIMLLLYNAIAMLLWKSTNSVVRTLTPLRVRELLLARSAIGILSLGRVILVIEPLWSAQDHELQIELVRLFNAERLRGPAGRVEIRIRDPSANSPAMRIAAG